MQHSVPSHRQILDEDLQIIRVTLATINDDVRGFSSRAADAITEALERLDRAQWEFTHLGSPPPYGFQSTPDTSGAGQ